MTSETKNVKFTVVPADEEALVDDRHTKDDSGKSTTGVSKWHPPDVLLFSFGCRFG